ncbi:MAG: HAD-IIIA family hydrolase [Ignavibacteria bacterium]|nr:HAD-IIIA family hydrolase [Ignavibacteria bacterium]
MNKALFLDRDGTILKEIPGETPETLGYLVRVKDVELIDGSADAIAAAKKLGYKIIIITNQSAVARGWLTIEELDKINSRMYSLLASSNPDAKIDALYFSPYHKEGTIEEYSIEHISRKPDIGMILDAKRDFDIDLIGSYMIGDAVSDMKCGEKAGLVNILVETGYGKMAKRKCLDEKLKIDFIASNLKEAVEFIQKNAENR